MPVPDSTPSLTSPTPPANRVERLDSLQRSLEDFANRADLGAATNEAARGAALHIREQIERLRRDSALTNKQVLHLLREIASQCTIAIDQLEQRARELRDQNEGDSAALDASRAQLLSRVQELRREIYQQLCTLQQSEVQSVPRRLALALGQLYGRTQEGFPAMSVN